MKIGDKKTFIPTGWTRFNDPLSVGAPTKVTGTVISVNIEHRWYRVEYTANGIVGHECFAFMPPHKAVRIVETLKTE